MAIQLHCTTRIFLVIALSACCFAGYSQKTIPDLRAELDKKISAKDKADICFTIADWYSNALKIDSALYYANKLKEYSQQGNYETGIGKYYFILSQVLYFRNKRDEAEENALKALEVFIQQKDNILIGRGYLGLGIVQYALNKTSSAKENCWKAISYFEPIQYKRGLYSVYFWVGRNYFKTSEIDSVSYYVIKTLSIAEQLNEPDKIFQAGCWAGDSFWSLGEYEKAIKYFEKGLKSRTSLSDKVGVRNYLSDYAICLVSVHEFYKVDSVINEIELLNAVLKDNYGILYKNWIKGAWEYENKNYAQAIKYLQDAYINKGGLRTFNSDIKDVVILLGQAEYENNSYDSAIAHLKSALHMSRKLRALTDEEEVNLLISKSYQQQEKPDSALHYFKNYSVLKDSIVSQQKQKTIIEVTTRYETEKKEQVIKMLQKEKETDAYALALKNQQIEKQRLEGEKKSQQLQLLSQQSEINRLEAVQKNLALHDQEREMIKKQKELESISKESRLRQDLATKESQKKKIAYAAALAVLIFGGIAFYRYRQSRKLGKQLAASLVSLKEAQAQLIKTEKEKEAENVRVRISRDIHDEVGATLSGVALYSEMAKQKMEDHQEKDAQLYLNHITANSKEMVEKMSDIVWAINPDNDSFERIADKLQSYAFNLCAGKGITLHLNIDNDLKKSFPAMQVKKNLYLFMKEALNNAIKYSGGKNIFLSLYRKDDLVTAEIKDDGRGFDPLMSFTGNGLKNMKARADSLDADLAVDSGKDSGTRILLRFHFHPGGGQMQKA